PPPSSFTLFPYTTLFRSLVQEVRQVLAHQRAAVRREGAAAAQHRLQPRVGGPFEEERVAVAQVLQPGEDVAVVVQREDHAGGGQDRKSTRLNSSHVKISY